LKVFQLKVSGTGITGDEFVYADVVLKSDYDALALAAAREAIGSACSSRTDMAAKLAASLSDCVEILSANRTTDLRAGLDVDRVIDESNRLLGRE